MQLNFLDAHLRWVPKYFISSVGLRIKIANNEWYLPGSWSRDALLIQFQQTLTVSNTVLDDKDVTINVELIASINASGSESRVIGVGVINPFADAKQPTIVPLSSSNMEIVMAQLLISISPASDKTSSGSYEATDHVRNEMLPISESDSQCTSTTAGNSQRFRLRGERDNNFSLSVSRLSCLTYDSISHHNLDVPSQGSYAALSKKINSQIQSIREECFSHSIDEMEMEDNRSTIILSDTGSPPTIIKTDSIKYPGVSDDRKKLQNDYNQNSSALMCGNEKRGEKVPQTGGKLFVKESYINGNTAKKAAESSYPPLSPSSDIDNVESEEDLLIEINDRLRHNRSTDAGSRIKLNTHNNTQHTDKMMHPEGKLPRNDTEKTQLNAINAKSSDLTRIEDIILKQNESLRKVESLQATNNNIPITRNQKPTRKALIHPQNDRGRGRSRVREDGWEFHPGKEIVTSSEKCGYQSTVTLEILRQNAIANNVSIRKIINDLGMHSQDVLEGQSQGHSQSQDLVRGQGWNVPAYVRAPGNDSSQNRAMNRTVSGDGNTVDVSGPYNCDIEPLSDLQNRLKSAELRRAKLLQVTKERAHRIASKASKKAKEIKEAVLQSCIVFDKLRDDFDKRNEAISKIRASVQINNRTNSSSNYSLTRARSVDSRFNMRSRQHVSRVSMTENGYSSAYNLPDGSESGIGMRGLSPNYLYRGQRQQGHLPFSNLRRRSQSVGHPARPHSQSRSQSHLPSHSQSDKSGGVGVGMGVEFRKISQQVGLIRQENKYSVEYDRHLQQGNVVGINAMKPSNTENATRYDPTHGRQIPEPTLSNIVNLRPNSSILKPNSHVHRRRRSISQRERSSTFVEIEKMSDKGSERGSGRGNPIEFVSHRHRSRSEHNDRVGLQSRSNLTSLHGPYNPQTQTLLISLVLERINAIKKNIPKASPYEAKKMLLMIEKLLNLVVVLTSTNKINSTSTIEVEEDSNKVLVSEGNTNYLRHFPDIGSRSRSGTEKISDSPMEVFGTGTVPLESTEKETESESGEDHSDSMSYSLSPTNSTSISIPLSVSALSATRPIVMNAVVLTQQKEVEECASLSQNKLKEIDPENYVRENVDVFVDSLDEGDVVPLSATASEVMTHDEKYEGRLTSDCSDDANEGAGCRRESEDEVRQDESEDEVRRNDSEEEVCMKDSDGEESDATSVYRPVGISKVISEDIAHVTSAINHLQTRIASYMSSMPEFCTEPLKNENDSDSDSDSDSEDIVENLKSFKQDSDVAVGYGTDDGHHHIKESTVQSQSATLIGVRTAVSTGTEEGVDISVSLWGHESDCDSDSDSDFAPNRFSGHESQSHVVCSVDSNSGAERSVVSPHNLKEEREENENEEDEDESSDDDYCTAGAGSTQISGDGSDSLNINFNLNFKHALNDHDEVQTNRSNDTTETEDSDDLDDDFDLQKAFTLDDASVSTDSTYTGRLFPFH